MSLNIFEICVKTRKRKAPNHSPYGSFRILHNNGVGPGNTVMMHNDDPTDPNYCRHRPNCANGDHVIPGTRAINNKTARLPTGELHYKHKFTNAQTAKIHKYMKAGLKGKAIYNLPAFKGKFTQKQIAGKISNLRRKKRKAHSSSV